MSSAIELAIISAAFNKVLFNNQECFITGRRSSGYFALKKLDGTVVSNSASYKKFKLLEISNNYITERMLAAHSFTTEVAGHLRQVYEDNNIFE